MTGKEVYIFLINSASCLVRNIGDVPVLGLTLKISKEESLYLLFSLLLSDTVLQKNEKSILFVVLFSPDKVKIANLNA